MYILAVEITKEFHTVNIDRVRRLPALDKRKITDNVRQINGLWAMQKRSHEDHIARPCCIAICIVLPYCIAKL